MIRPFLYLLLLICSVAKAEEFLYLEPFMDMRGFEGEVEVLTEDYESFYLSLESLKEVLKVDLTIHEGRIEGWFFFQNNRISGDLNQGTVMVKDEQLTIEGRDFIEFEEQYFASAQVIKKWFDVEVQVEINRLLINFDTQGRHPYFESLKRKSRHGALDTLKAQEHEVLVIDNQYRWFTWPSSDLRVNHSLGKDKQTNIISSAVFDLAAHSIDFLAASNNGQENFRLTARREASMGDNPFHYEVGDVFFPAGKFLRASFNGRGIALLGNPISRSYSRNFKVEGLPGWEVELYRDDQLIDYSQLDELGQYQFEGIDISAGHNKYKAVLYGPNGEIREQHFDFNVSNMGLYKGKWLPELYLIDPQEPTLGSAQQQSELGRTAVGRLNYGLSNRINLGVGMVKDFDDSSKTTPFAEMLYISDTQVLDVGIGAPSNTDELSYSADYSINTRFGTFLLSNYNAFLYEQSSFQKGSAGRWQLSIDDYDMGLSVTKQYLGEQSQNLYDANFGVRFEDSQWSNNVSFVDSNNFSFNTLARIRLGEQLLQLRGEYRKNQGQATEQLYVAWRKQFKKHALNINANYSTQDHQFKFNAELSSQWDRFNFGARLSHDAQNKFTLVLTMSTAFAWDDPFGSLNRSSYKQSATLRARTYKDNNANQRFDQGDTPLKGVKLIGSSQWKSTTDAQGNHTLYGLQSYTPQYLEINTDALDDPFVSPIKEKFRVTSHPGGEVQLDIPFYDIYEVEGDIVIRQENGQDVGKGAVPLYLVKDGQIIQEIKSEYDGYFLFDKVMPGKYHLVIAPHWLEKKSLTMAEGVVMTLNLDSNSDSMVTMEPIVLMEQ